MLPFYIIHKSSRYYSQNLCFKQIACFLVKLHQIWNLHITINMTYCWFSSEIPFPTNHRLDVSKTLVNNGLIAATHLNWWVCRISEPSTVGFTIKINHSWIGKYTVRPMGSYWDSDIVPFSKTSNTTQSLPATFRSTRPTPTPWLPVTKRWNGSWPHWCGCLIRIGASSQDA